jgi:hypothetical protein
MTVGGRTLRRNPTPVETAASVDFAAMEDQFTTAQTSLVDQWLADVKAEQVAALRALIEETDSLAELAALDAPILGESLLVDHMTTLAEQAGAEAVAEAAAQGVTIDEFDIAEMAEEIDIRAGAQATVMARSIVQAASQRAIAEAAPDWPWRRWPSGSPSTSTGCRTRT